MHTPSPFSSIIIGEGTLPVQCAEILIAAGHALHGVISADSAVQRWAQERQIAHCHPGDNVVAMLGGQPFDYLFSIVNSAVLPEELLALPHRWAINYHDAPLPRYAGTHATSWALMQRESTHGVTWHIMSDVVDAGQILKQQQVDIAHDETALTLNAKCYEAAIQSFTLLVADLARDAVVPVTQDLSARTYFPRHKRPPGAAVLVWHHPAEDLAAQVRALDFGPYPNALGRAKVAVGGEALIVSRMTVLDTASPVPPGTITHVGDDDLTVATATKDVALGGLLTLDGQSLALQDVVRRHGLYEGFRLTDLQPEMAERLTACNAELARHEAFWVDRLATVQPVILPVCRRQAVPTADRQYRSVRWAVPPELASSWGEGARGWDRGDAMIAAFGVLLARVGTLCSFDVGYAESALRQRLAGLETIFATSVPLHLDLSRRMSFPEVYDAVHRQVETVRRRQTFARDLWARYPRLQATGNKRQDTALSVGVERVDRLDGYEASGDHDLTLVIAEGGTKLDIAWVYDPLSLQDDALVRLQGQFLTLLRGITATPNQAIASLPLLTGEELRHLLVDFNPATTPIPREASVPRLFEAQAEKTPDAVALTCAGTTLTYGELNRRANQVAHWLRAMGVGPEVLVGLCLERSVELIVGLLGILKAGGAYVPLDPASPPERLAFMATDAGISVMLTQQLLRDALPSHVATIACMDEQWSTIVQQDDRNTSPGLVAENLAYVNYTSGSTGRPKGVSISHQGVVRLVKGIAYASLTADDVFLHLAPISFDAATFEIWGCLLNGGRLVIFPAHTPSLDEIGDIVRHQGVTILWLTAGLFHQVVEHCLDDMSSVRQLLAGGDVLSPPHVRKVLRDLPHCRLINGYGPTESTTFTCCHPITTRDQDETVPIGRPIANTQVYVLDADLQPVPVGVEGELYIGGAGLARGYLNRSDLTAEMFLPHPFSTVPGARLYRAGDLARYQPDGTLQFVGRRDHQVKIRGFRIELGEIEAVVGQYPTVREAALVVWEAAPGDKRLVAYLVADGEPVATVADIDRFLRERLPEYMVPAAYVLLATLPLTLNGKIDRAALPEPSWGAGKGTGEGAPRTPLEELVAGIWSEVLGLKGIGIHDNFFALGGHSLLATRVVARLRDAVPVALPLRALFDAPTPAGIASVLTAALAEQEQDGTLARLLAAIERSGGAGVPARDEAGVAGVLS